MATKGSSSSSKRMMMVKNEEENTTIVANFPEDIIEAIISFLPLKKAFSSGLLSKRFLNSWKLSCDLSFDIDYRTLTDRSDIFKLIQFVMNEHCGPVIRRFKIILDPSGKENQVRNWIQKVISKGVQELDLDFSSGNVRFLFPADILKVSSLQILKVCYCDLDPLKQMDSLRYLKIITLEDIFTPRYLLDAIFSSCLLLENFEMTNSYSEHCLVIQAGKLKKFKSLKVIRCSYILSMYIDTPVLQVFHYIGEICRIVSKREMPKIEEVTLHFDPSRSINLFPGVEEFMIAIRRTKFLSFSSTILERLCPKFFESYYKEFNPCLENLKEIRLYLGGSTGSLFTLSTNVDPYDIACFLRKCPCLEKIFIDFGVFPLEKGPYWELVAKHKFENYVTKFKFLKYVCLKNFKFFNLEMELAAFILASAVDLERCVIVKAKRYPGAKEDELDFVHSLAEEKFETTIYEHKEYTSSY